MADNTLTIGSRVRFMRDTYSIPRGSVGIVVAVENNRYVVRFDRIVGPYNTFGEILAGELLPA